MGHVSNFILCCIFTSFILTLTQREVECANIAFFFGVSTYSHRIPAWPLATALAEKGHKVTFILPFAAKNPHPKVVDYAPLKLKEWVESWDGMDVFAQRKAGTKAKLIGWMSLPGFGIAMCDVIYSDPEFVKWVKTTKIDLVFIDSLFNDCGYGLAHVTGAKVIQFATSTTFPWYPDSFGNPDETSWIPDGALPFDSTTVTFKQRLINALMPVTWHLYRSWKYFPRLEEITREELGLGLTYLPKFEEIERNTSLVFLNTHYGEEFGRSLPPNVISIGGIAYTEKRTPLPKELTAFLEKGKDFIYISFGTHAEFEKMDSNAQQAIIGAMRSNQNMLFVWKAGNDSLAKEFPRGNVFVSNWMPQQDLLAHPKIRAFITHSGLMGIQEGIINAVPLISFPIFAEQDYNAERIHRKECGIRVEITTVTQAELEEAITKIVNEPKYRENMKKVSRIFTDRPQKPLETALWWTDFVLTHSREDLESLRPLSVGQLWWVRRQLDVWMTILVTLVIGAIAIVFILLKALKYFCSSFTTLRFEEIHEYKKQKLQ